MSRLARGGLAFSILPLVCVVALTIAMAPVRPPPRAETTGTPIPLPTDETPAPDPTPDPTAAPSPTPTPTPAPTAPVGLAPLRVSGNRLVDATGHTVVVHGVARSGTEYSCIQGWGIFDGPSDAASLIAIRSWRANAVRVPLNEQCWLATPGVPPQYAGAAYQQAIVDYVTLLNENGLYAILDLHWSAPSDTPAIWQKPMPDAELSPLFWSQVAAAFKGNDAVIFELFNEPYPDNNFDSDAAWLCWRDGGTCPGVAFEAAGMQTLVNAVRATGATNVIAVGGIQYSNTLTRWLEFRPVDPLNNIVATLHIYEFTICNNVACFERTAAPVLAEVPLIASEIGMHVCDATFWNMVMDWFDAHDTGYLAWSWTNWGDTCARNTLVRDYDGTPTEKGAIFKDHLAGLP